jgi:sialate O-acetylesterase
MKKVIFPILIIWLTGCKTPNQFIELPSIISSGMVLQQNTDVVIWGKSTPSTRIKISTSWGNQTKIKSDESGNWKTKIKTTAAGGPYELVFQTRDTTITVKDVLLGEVWLCSGQSNMEMTLKGWPPSDTINNSAREIASADFPLIRMFTVPRNTSVEPITNCKASWNLCSPQNAGSFSATAYFFGKKLHQELGVPVGLIHSSWGGTPAQSWISKEYVSIIPAYKNIADSMGLALIQYDTLFKWMETLKQIELPVDTQSYAVIAAGDSIYSDFEINDSNWSLIKLPSFWESSVLPNFDGVVWFRKEFELPVTFKDKSMVLHLGAIDDMDATFINGVEVGSTLKPGFWKYSREYSIPKGILKIGKNIVTVKVIDIMGGGGIYDKGGINISDKNSDKSVINLDGEWKYLVAAELLKGKIYVYDNSEKTFANRPHISVAINAYQPTTLYNAMIYPLIPYTIQGVIWYQGEANVGKAFEYRSLFPALIECWRNVWGEGDFPFYYVQIAPWNYGEELPSSSAELREAQLMTLKLPNTGMVVTTDIGNPLTIHPSDKQEVGRRLALLALSKNYGKDTLVYSGPLYSKLEINGNKITIHFTHTEGGLVAKDGPLTFFEIAGEDQKYIPAYADIKGETIEVWSDKVPKPVAVRFGWSQVANPNLFNGAGLPASPFRTDNWKRLTEN